MTVLIGGEPISRSDIGMSGGPTFYGGHGELIGNGGLVAKRAKSKAARLPKKIRKALQERPSTGIVFGYELEEACSKAARSALLRTARDVSSSRPRRTAALMQLDACSCAEPVAAKGMLTKSAKKLPKADRKRLKHDALYADDIQRRIRAQNVLFGSLG